MTYRCSYCANRWKSRELEPGGKCPTCGATVSEPATIKRECETYYDHQMRGTVVRTRQDGRTVDERFISDAWERLLMFKALTPPRFHGIIHSAD